MRYPKDENRSMILAALAGAAFGALAGWLLVEATKAKRKERLYPGGLNGFLPQNLNTKIRNLVDLVTHKTGDWIDQALHTSEEIAQEVRDWSEAVRAAAENAQLQVKDLEQREVSHVAEILNWSEKAIEVTDRIIDEVHRLSKKAHEETEDFHIEEEDLEIEEGNSPKNHAYRRPEDSISQFVEWGLLGLNLFQSLRQSNRK